MNECIDICLRENDYKKYKKKYHIINVIGSINNALKHTNINHELAFSYGEYAPTIYVLYDYQNKNFNKNSNDNIICYNCYLNHIVFGFQDFLETIYLKNTDNIKKHKLGEIKILP